MENVEKMFESKQVSRRLFLGRTGRVIALSALANFALIGSAKALTITTKGDGSCTATAAKVCNEDIAKDPCSSKHKPE